MSTISGTHDRRMLGRLATVGVAILVGGLIATGCGSSSDPKADSPSASSQCQADTATDPGSEHVDAATFAVNPPSGGDHLATAARAGFYDSGTVVPPDGNAVHALEHGYVAIWYQPTLNQADLDALRKVFKAYPKDVLVLPRPSLTQPVAATAWHQRLLCPTLDTAALTAFVKTYRNQGPEKIPHG